MTPAHMAALAARAYHHMTPWSADAFAQTLDTPFARLFASERAFLLVRLIADEAEILALATDPDRQRSGQASQLLQTAMPALKSEGASEVFLEVAAANLTARAFYAARGFAPTGLRRAYYRTPSGGTDDAVLMSRTLG